MSASSVSASSVWASSVWASSVWASFLDDNSPPANHPLVHLAPCLRNTDASLLYLMVAHVTELVLVYKRI